MPSTLRPGALLLAVVVALAGCRPHRLLLVESDPPGALVRLDEEVIGTTPLEHEFLHYGRRRLTLYHEGYRTWSKRLRLRPPWYSRFPLDLVTEVLVPLGLTDRHDVQARLRPDTGSAAETEAETEAFVARAATLRAAGGEPPRVVMEPPESEAADGDVRAVDDPAGEVP